MQQINKTQKKSFYCCLVIKTILSAESRLDARFSPNISLLHGILSDFSFAATRHAFLLDAAFSAWTIRASSLKNNLLRAPIIINIYFIIKTCLFKFITKNNFIENDFLSIFFIIKYTSSYCTNSNVFTSTVVIEIILSNYYNINICCLDKYEFSGIK